MKFKTSVYRMLFTATENIKKKSGDWMSCDPKTRRANGTFRIEWNHSIQKHGSWVHAQQIDTRWSVQTNKDATKDV